MRPIMLVVGTRPEGIKMMPVYSALRQANIPTLLCATSQHIELLADIFSTFSVTPDIDLKIMKKDQDLFYITSTVLNEMKKVFNIYKPSLVLAQGDTTTVMATALAAFYAHIPVGHIEAGLRTGDLYSPYPEEYNRVTLGTLSTYHFSPTAQACANLLSEGKKRENIFYVGNTVVDALRIIEDKITKRSITIDLKIAEFFTSAHQKNNKTLLFTMHRRESFEGGIQLLIASLKTFAQAHPEVSILYPFHPNPHVMQAIEKNNLRSTSNILLTEPLSYKDLAYTLLTVDAIATDSGGIQEEAISLGKRVLVLREKTERMEGVWEGLATIIGFDAKKFIFELQKMFTAPTYISLKRQIYGDGFAAEKIVEIIQTHHAEYRDSIGIENQTLHHMYKERRV